MNTEFESVKAVSERIRDVEDRLLEGANILAATKERLVFDPRAYKKRNAARPLAVAGIVTAAAAAALLIFFVQPKPLTVDADGKPLGVGAWISSATGNGTTLAFSDGSSIQLNAASGMRIRDLAPDGAHLLLERGALDAGVVHRDKAKWKLDVGPYVITVVGTKFHVSWSPDTETFGLEMKEGSVVVEGPMLAARTVQQGESLSASLYDGTVEINIGGRPKAVRPSPQTEMKIAEIPLAETHADFPAKAEETEVITKARPESLGKSRTRESPTAKSVEWQTLADKGQFADAVRAAEQEGIRTILDEAKARDLLILGDAARHAGDYALAANSYKSARRRFPGSTHASGAAFALGIMAFDGRKDYQEAVRWFLLCRKDNRSGNLSREASGRLMEAYRLLGDEDAAGRAATEYLTNYPNGPHAALARRLTQ